MRNAGVLLTALMLVAVLAVGAAAGEVTGKFAITPLAGLNVPIQYLQETNGGGGAKLGFAFGATGEYFLSENVSVGGQVFYNRFGMDFEGKSSPDDWEGNWTILQFGLFGKYTLLPGGKTRPFARGGVLFGKADAEITDPSGIKTELDVSFSPGLELAVGAIHEVAENISVYGEAEWTLVATDGADADETRSGSTVTGELEKHLQWIGVKAGVSFFFGGPRK